MRDAQTRKIMRIVLMLLLAVASAVPAAFAAEDEQPPRDLTELRERIDGILEQTQTPAIGIALVNEEGPYWVAGWGKASLATGKAANQDTLFRIGSISKMFVALAVLKLQEEGKLSLDDKLRDLAPEIEFENPWEDTHPVRLVHLLEHTTGWDDIHLPEYAFAAPDTMPLKEALAYHPHSRVSRWMPGTRHAYCNSGPTVAAYVVEKVTGERFEDYIASTFFAPLGMDSTSYFKTKRYDERGATLYLQRSPQEYWQIIYRPSGSINSSASDMAKLVHFLLLRGATPTTRILSEHAIDRMEIPATTLGAAAGVIGGYGLGNYTTGYKASGVAFHGHNGGVIGGLSELAYVKELGQGYVVMINSGNGAALSQLSDLIRGFLLKDVSPQDPAQSRELPEQFKNLAGYYKPINPRQELLRFITDIGAITKIWSDEQLLHRKPLFGAWVSNDYPGGNGTLVDGWHGLPAIAVVEDPLAGPAVQVNTDLWQRISTVRAFAPLAVVGAMLAMTLIGFVALVIWCYRRFASKTSSDHRTWMRLWPLLSTVALIVFLVVLSAAGVFLKYAGTVSALSVGILALSLSYPLFVLLGIIELFKTKNRSPKNLPYWYAAAFSIVHASVVVYLAVYGVIGIRTWT